MSAILIWAVALGCFWLLMAALLAAFFKVAVHGPEDDETEESW